VIMEDAWRSHVRGDIGYSTGGVYRDSFRFQVMGFVACFVISCIFSIVPVAAGLFGGPD